MHKAFFARLLDSHDPSADSLIFLSFVGALSLIGFAGYDLVIEKHSFNGLEFGTGFASILAGLGGAKALRGIGEPPRRPSYHGTIDNPDA